MSLLQSYPCQTAFHAPALRLLSAAQKELQKAGGQSSELCSSPWAPAHSSTARHLSQLSACLAVWARLAVLAS
jgi:hypothetical protein